MKEQLQAIINKGFKPVLFIDDYLMAVPEVRSELRKVIKYAKLNSIVVVRNLNLNYLKRVKRAYVIRYGGIPKFIEAAIKRNGGEIVSGDIIVD